jgi:hypothetical protein
MYLSVSAVKPLENYKLELLFENNEKRIFDVAPYLDRGVFQKLKDKNYFKNVKVAFDTVEWSDEIDIDPEVLYEDSVSAACT